MNENLNLVEILKDCPRGTKLYSLIHGDVELVAVSLKEDAVYSIEIKLSDFSIEHYTKDGRVFADYLGECVLFPSKDQRDWSKFKPKKERFDTNTLIPYMKVLVRDKQVQCWRCSFFSHKNRNTDPSSHTYKYATPDNSYKYCIPYNNETKYLVGTTEEAPEFYRYWED